MEPNNKKTLIRYLMKGIFSGEWKEGDKIFSLQQLSIKFGVSKLTAAKVVSEFVSKGWLDAREKKGIYLAQNFFALFPLSFRKMLNVDADKVNTKVAKITEGVSSLDKEYLVGDEIVATNFTIISSDKFDINTFDKNKPLLLNLTEMDITPLEIEEYTSFELTDDERSLHISRRFFNEEKDMYLVEEFFINPRFYHREVKTKFF
ncbi:GntR family transcriptional regulator [Mycoplasma todarodis]|uniref:HTH gntR-type domain-containing protein n=1 Tax=Mycoplasma todarodis TaxID=1937191 RepID=A0A4R0XPF0_9MOLU|nr:GntR family transcriptional regulator [Mycoplasma todarodis]TCG10775.1 hypothetical protein C4B25_03060 [Mycoplasma todarodis]